MKLSLICPCYNEGKNIRAFFDTCVEVLDGKVGGYEFVFVNDGSQDDTWEKLSEIFDSTDKSVKLVNLSRNFGKEAAMYAGLCRAEGEYTVIIDTDLQQRPETVLEMVGFLDNNPDFDVVCAYQQKRKESKFISGCKSLFYKLINRISKAEIVDGARDFQLMKRKVVDAVLSLGEYNRFSKGIFGWIGFRKKWLEYENVERVAGETKWSFWKLTLYAIQGIVAFSTTPLVLSSVFGILCCVLAFIMIVFVIVRKLVYGDPTAGWPSLVCIMLLLSGIQMLGIGIVGQYLAKTYLETKKRPIYLVGETNLEKGA